MTNLLLGGLTSLCVFFCFCSFLFPLPTFLVFFLPCLCFLLSLLFRLLFDAEKLCLLNSQIKAGKEKMKKEEERSIRREQKEKKKRN